jgi:hypothetical protein
MPVRLVRPWTDSEKVDSLGDAAEVFFLRLIMCADDYGRFTADPRLLKAALYPLRDIRVADLSRLLQKCEHSGLIAVYNGADGKPYAAIKNFGQRMRAKTSKYPAPPDELPTDDNHLPDTCPSHDSHMTALDEDGDEGEKERESARTQYALDAERIVSLYPKAKVGDWQQAILAVSAAIQREIDRGISPERAVGIVELGTIAYADAVKKWTHKQFISQAVKFYNDGMYNFDAATWERETKSPQANSRKSGGYDWRNPDTWGEE